MMMKRWSLLAALAGVVLFSWWAGCSNPNLAGGKLHFDQAGNLKDEAERQARFERARETFQMACREMPKSGEARLWLGKSFAELGQPDSASYYFERAVALDTLLRKDVQDNRDHYWSLQMRAGQSAATKAQDAKTAGDSTQAEKLYRDALADLARAETYSPTQYQTFSTRGVVLVNLRDIEPAIENFRHAIDLAKNAKPEDRIKVERQLYGIYLLQGEKSSFAGEQARNAGDSTAARVAFEAAQSYFRRAIELRPSESRLNYWLGILAYELSQLVPEQKDALLAEAVERYNTILSENPADVEVLYSVVGLLRDKGDYAAAREYATRMVDLDPRNGSYRDILGRVEGQLGNKDALFAGVAFGTALKRGVRVAPEQAGTRAEAHGPGSDLKRRYLENGPPEEILTFDSQGIEYEVWLYWIRGTGYGFVQGAEKFASKFAPSGVLSISDEAIVEKAPGTKVLKGTVTNDGTREYTYVRVEYTVSDEDGEALGTVFTSIDKLISKGKWNFEIPLTAEYAAAATFRKSNDVGVYAF